MEHRIATYLGGDAMLTALGSDTQESFRALAEGLGVEGAGG